MRSCDAPDVLVMELQDRLEKTNGKLHDLATMGAMISSKLEIDEILSVFMEMSIRVVDGEVGVIQLVEDGELATRINWGADDTVIKAIGFEDGRDISAYCFENKTPVIIEKYERKMEYGPNINSVIAVPIKSGSGCHGTIVIINKADGSGFGDQDRANLEMLVNFAAVAIDKANLLQESLERQRIQQELEIARQIQKAILPANEIAIRGVDIGTLYIPAREIGGDFYDIIDLGDGRLFIAVGDVSNKGIPAALVMSATSAIIKAELKDLPQITPARLMTTLNEILCDGIIRSHNMFATLFIARIDLNEKKLQYCNAGHIPPLYQVSGAEEILELKSGGTFVGQFADIDYMQGEIDIKAGDRLFAFTDGLTEAEDAEQNLFGLERVRQVFMSGAEPTAAAFCRKVKVWVNRFAEGAGEETVDDFTLFEMRFPGDQ